MTETIPSNTQSQAANTGPAQYELGVNYMLGRNGVSADLGMAIASFMNAADLNEPRGLYATGMMYLKGVGITANVETAMSYLQKSATIGYQPASAVLDALSKGNDVKAFQIIAAEQKRVDTTAIKDAKLTGSSPSNPVTPTRVLVIVIAALLVLGGAGGGYWYWNKIQAEKQEAAERVRLADEERKRVEDEQKRAVETERQRLVAEAQAAKERADAAETERQRLEAEAQSAKERADAAESERQRLVAEAQTERERANAADRKADAVKQKMSAQQAELEAKAETLRQNQRAALPAPATTNLGKVSPTQATPVLKTEQKSIDEQYNERAAKECQKGFFGLVCRESMKAKLCDGTWTANPPQGQSLCKR